MDHKGEAGHGELAVFDVLGQPGSGNPTLFRTNDVGDVLWRARVVAPIQYSSYMLINDDEWTHLEVVPGIDAIPEFVNAQVWDIDDQRQVLWHGRAYLDGTHDPYFVARDHDVLLIESESVIDGRVFLGSVNITDLSDSGEWALFPASVEPQAGSPYATEQALVRLRFPISSCTGDVTGDGRTDSADLNAVLGAFATECGACALDVSGDGHVGGEDLQEILVDFGCTV